MFIIINKATEVKVRKVYLMTKGTLKHFKRINTHIINVVAAEIWEIKNKNKSPFCPDSHSSKFISHRKK